MDIPFAKGYTEIALFESSRYVIDSTVGHIVRFLHEIICNVCFQP